MNNKNLPPADPDIWTVLSLVVSTVSMVAQLAGLKANAPSKGLADQNTAFVHEKIHDELDSAIRNCEKLIRLLGNTAHNSINP